MSTREIIDAFEQRIQSKTSAPTSPSKKKRHLGLPDPLAYGGQTDLGTSAASMAVPSAPHPPHIAKPPLNEDTSMSTSTPTSSSSGDGKAGGGGENNKHWGKNKWQVMEDKRGRTVGVVRRKGEKNWRNYRVYVGDEEATKVDLPPLSEGMRSRAGSRNGKGSKESSESGGREGKKSGVMKLVLGMLNFGGGKEGKDKGKEKT